MTQTELQQARRAHARVIGREWRVPAMEAAKSGAGGKGGEESDGGVELS